MGDQIGHHIDALIDIGRGEAQLLQRVIDRARRFAEPSCRRAAVPFAQRTEHSREFLLHSGDVGNAVPPESSFGRGCDRVTT
ncbi:Uncharacterised protein [Mycobacteroides abscessus]|nr:Uncharacterised protein [Mycobacteroides abscessus]